MSPVEPIYGTSEWAAGYTDGEPVEQIQDELSGDVSDEAFDSEEWSTLQRSALFVFIIGCVALYVGVSRRRASRKEAAYQKIMA